MACYKKIIIILSIICIVLCFSLHAYAESVSPFSYGSMSLIPEKFSDYANTNKFVILTSFRSAAVTGVFLFKKFSDNCSFIIDNDFFKPSKTGLFVPIKNLSYENNNINFPVLDWDKAVEKSELWVSNYFYYNSPDVIDNTPNASARGFVPLINAYQDFMPNSSWTEHVNDFWAYEYIEIKNRIFWHSASKPLYFITNNRVMNKDDKIHLNVVFQNKDGSTDIVSDYDLRSNNYQFPITDEFFSACKNLSKGDNNIIKFNVSCSFGKYGFIDAYTFSVYVKESDFSRWL